MTVRRVSVSRGTPAEIASHASGYAGSGLSIYTRSIAHRQPQFHSGAHTRLQGAGERTLAQKIQYERERMRHAEAQLRIEDNPERRAKLAQQIDIKAGLIAKWTAEQNGEIQ